MGKRKKRKIAKKNDVENDKKRELIEVNKKKINDLLADSYRKYSGEDFRLKIMTGLDVYTFKKYLLPKEYDEDEHSLKLPKIKKISTLKDIADLVFTKENIRLSENRWKERALTMVIKRAFRTKDLKDIIEKYFPDEKVPKLYKKRIEMLVCRLIGVETDASKRNMEIENLNKMDSRIFVTLCDTVVPDDIMLIILSFLKKDRELLDIVGCLNEDFHLLCQLSWERLEVRRDNLFKIPVLVLRSAKLVIVQVNGISKKGFVHLTSNILNARKLMAAAVMKGGEYTNPKRGRILFSSMKTKLERLQHLDIYNIQGLKIQRKHLPNVSFFEVDHFEGVKKKLSLMEEYQNKQRLYSGLSPINKNEPRRLEPETLEFLCGITTLKLHSDVMHLLEHMKPCFSRLQMKTLVLRECGSNLEELNEIYKSFKMIVTTGKLERLDWSAPRNKFFIPFMKNIKSVFSQHGCRVSHLTFRLFYHDDDVVDGLTETYLVYVLQSLAGTEFRCVQNLRLVLFNSHPTGSDGDINMKKVDKRFKDLQKQCREVLRKSRFRNDLESDECNEWKFPPRGNKIYFKYKYNYLRN